MNSDDKYWTAPHEPSPGSLERPAPDESDPVGKSLLSLIQERAHRTPAVAETGVSHESDRSSWEIGENTDQAVDLMAIRLGGNGF